MIHPLEPKVLFDFVFLFPEEEIKHIHFEMYNGTETRTQELNGGDAYLERERFAVSGKCLNAIVRAFDMVEFNQIQSVRVEVGKKYTSYFLDALDRKATFHSLDHVDIATIKAFKEKNSIDKVTITL